MMIFAHNTACWFLFVLAWVNVRLYIQGPDPGIEFLVDDMSLKEVPEMTSWREDAEQSIEQNRKTNFTIK